MKLITVISAGVLSLALVAACPAFAQEQHEEEKSKPSGQEEKQAQPEKSTKQAQPEKSAKQAQPEKSAKQAQPEKSAKQAQPEKPAKQQEKPSAQRESNAKPAEKNAKQDNNNAKPAEKNAKQDNNNAKPTNKNVQQQQHASAGHNGVSKIPQDRYQANFGREHTFRVSQGDYQNHRFQYGGYWFGFADPWPSNWLYTQDVFVVEIDGVYYLCNASYPGVNVALSFTV
jgi:glucan-binding YG repeat protein